MVPISLPPVVLSESPKKVGDADDSDDSDAPLQKKKTFPTVSSSSPLVKSGVTRCGGSRLITL